MLVFGERVVTGEVLSDNEKTVLLKYGQNNNLV